jgi:hypothetical protein
MLKAFGMTMLVASLLFGLVFAVAAKPGESKEESETSVSINASFTIPSWISLSVVGNGDVSFGEIAGGGGYTGDNETELRVLSTTSWSLSSEILWSESEMPDDASQTLIENALALTMSADGGTWGIHTVSVSYEMDVSDEDLAELPSGDYNLVIQYTATTD